MKAKHALGLFAIGYCFDFVGAFFKIEHWLYGDSILITATILKVLGAALLLYKALTYPKFKDFLNW